MFFLGYTYTFIFLSKNKTNACHTVSWGGFGFPFLLWPNSSVAEPYLEARIPDLDRFADDKPDVWNMSLFEHASIFLAFIWKLVSGSISK